jgi:hypothetical protein
MKIELISVDSVLSLGPSNKSKHRGPPLPSFSSPSPAFAGENQRHRQTNLIDKFVIPLPKNHATKLALSPKRKTRCECTISTFLGRLISCLPKSLFEPPFPASLMHQLVFATAPPSIVAGQGTVCLSFAPEEQRLSRLQLQAIADSAQNLLILNWSSLFIRFRS